MWTDQFNHAPAELLLHTGSPRFGSASMGSWVTYGLGSENQDLPGFVVLVSGDSDPSAGKSVWGSGFLPSVYQGVQCRTSGEPILYVSDPRRHDARRSPPQPRRAAADSIESKLAEFGDPETLTRISQYELAYRMQVSVPNVMDISREPAHVHDAYGTKPGVTALCQQLPAGPAARRAGRALRAALRLGLGHARHGPRQRPRSPACPRNAGEVDRPIAALLQRSQIARPVG